MSKIVHGQRLTYSYFMYIIHNIDVFAARLIFLCHIKNTPAKYFYAKNENPKENPHEKRQDIQGIAKRI